MHQSAYWLTDTNGTVHYAVIEVLCHLKSKREIAFDDHFSNSTQSSVDIDVPVILVKDQGHSVTTGILSLHASQTNLNVLS